MNKEARFGLVNIGFVEPAEYCALPKPVTQDIVIDGIAVM